MCSRNSSDDLILHKTYGKTISDTCRKCSMKANVLLQSKFSYCRKCFLERFKHKFCATLGKSKIMKHGDKILIGFSGSASSLCLIDLVRDSLNDGKKKKMSFDVNVLFIDESSAFNSDEIVLTDLNEIKGALEPYKFKLYCTDLGAFYAKDINLEINHLYNEADNIILVKELFQEFPILTSKTDLLIKLRHNVLFKVAQKLGCQKIFSAETSDHLAVNTISNIVQGRGSQLPKDVSFCDDRTNGLILVRPLQDCSKKEVAFYNIFNNLKQISYSSFSTKGDKYSSIQKLSECFINELQNSFPSTVLTIHATGGKLSAAQGTDKSLNCCLCQGNIDEKKLLLSAQQASHISRIVSSLGKQGFDSTILIPNQNLSESCDDSVCCVSNGDTQCRQKEIFTNKSLNNCLCYGCQLILRECKSVESLPKEFLIKLQEQLRFQKMHEEIKTFLL